MGWKYEVETFFYEEDGIWKTGYVGNSLFGAIRGILKHRKEFPGRCYRLIIR